MSQVIDAHQHFWDFQRFSYGWIRSDDPVLGRSYLPDDLAPELAAAGVDRTVLVQAQGSAEENRWMLDLAGAHPFIAGVVGNVDLTAPQVASTLDELATEPRFVGVRFTARDAGATSWLERPDVHHCLRALAARDLAFDLLIRPAQLRQVPALAAAVPELRIVIDHLANPPIASGELDGWLGPMRSAAAMPNVCCKLSGMVTLAEHVRWTAADLKPYVHAVVEAFGFERVMFGSDWPVCRKAGEYGRVVEGLSEALGPISDAERRLVWGGVAARFYGLA